MVFFFYHPISGTYSTKMDEDVYDWRSLIISVLIIGMNTLSPFKNLFFDLHFLTSSVTELYINRLKVLRGDVWSKKGARKNFRL